MGIEDKLEGLKKTDLSRMCKDYEIASRTLTYCVNRYEGHKCTCRSDYTMPYTKDGKVGGREYICKVK